MKAIWNGTVIAESDNTVEVEGNQYFHIDTIKREHFKPIDATSMCPWKGTANYFDVVVGDETNGGAAWYYKEPKEAAANIKDHVAFWKGVTVET